MGLAFGGLGFRGLEVSAWERRCLCLGVLVFFFEGLFRVLGFRF